MHGEPMQIGQPRAILIYLCTFFLRESGEIFPPRRRELLSEMTPKPKKAIGQDLQDLQDYRKSANSSGEPEFNE